MWKSWLKPDFLSLHLASTKFGPVTSIMRFSVSPIIAALISVIVGGLFPLLVGLDRTPVPWIDEVVFASTSISVAKGHPATPAVLAAFPKTGRTGRLDLFYGPVGIKLGALWLSYAGVSEWNWRIIGFVGGILIIALSGVLLSVLRCGWLERFLGMFFVAFSAELGGRINSGRLDTVTVSLELLVLVLLVLAIQSTGWRIYFYSSFAGVAIFAAGLSTPRALTFCIALAAGTVAVLCRKWRGELAAGLLLSGTISAVLLCAWTISQGLTPVAWLRFLFRTANGDAGDVSPLLGGAWTTVRAIYPPELIFPFLSIVIAVGLIWFYSKLASGGSLRTLIPSDLLFLLVVGVVNLFLSFLLLSRALDYEIFYTFPIIISIFVLTVRMNHAEYEGGRLKKVIWSCWILFAVLGVGIRTAKIAELLQSWSVRDPKLISAFVREHVPPGSTVFGDDPCYYWAVYKSGSNYLLTSEMTTPGLASRDDTSVELLLHKNRNTVVYLFWRRDSKKPLPLGPSQLRLLGIFQGPSVQSPLFPALRRWIGYGYPQGDLYVVAPARADSDN